MSKTQSETAAFKQWGDDEMVRQMAATRAAIKSLSDQMYFRMLCGMDDMEPGQEPDALMDQASDEIRRIQEAAFAGVCALGEQPHGALFCAAMAIAQGALSQALTAFQEGQVVN